jgi:hypothetical protein
MLLIPYIENAFKHGSIVNGFLMINVEIRIAGSRLDFSIQNSFVEHSDGQSQGGVGLPNIRKRLDLSYPNNYQLESKITGKWYLVKLCIFDLNTVKNEG